MWGIRLPLHCPARTIHPRPLLPPTCCVLVDDRHQLAADNRDKLGVHLAQHAPRLQLLSAQAGRAQLRKQVFLQRLQLQHALSTASSLGPNDWRC